MEKFEESLRNMRVLSVESCERIHGGSSLFYWIAYGIGYVMG